MKTIIAVFFPPQANNSIRGSKLPWCFLILVAGIGIVRSCIHIFTSDGGAGSIAGMDLSVTGADEVVFAFALWGSAQLIYALIQWIVILRYRSLVPLMWGVQLCETLGRIAVGQLKPVTFEHTPPGAIQNYVYVILAVLMMLISLWQRNKVDLAVASQQ